MPTLADVLGDIPTSVIFDCEQLHRIAKDDFVYLSGSLVEGLGNAWSDIDVYVVSDLKPVGDSITAEGAAAVSNHLLESRRIDYEYWPPAYLDELATRLANLRPGQRVTGVLSLVDEVFLHRLLIGLPLSNEGALARAQSRIRKDDFALYLSKKAIEATNGIFEDVGGMIESGDVEAGLFRCRDLLAAALDAFVHSRGQTNPNPKWRIKVAARVFEGAPDLAASLYDPYWKLAFPHAQALRRDRQAALEYMRAVLVHSERLVAAAQP